MEVPKSKNELNRSKELVSVIYLTNIKKSFAVRSLNLSRRHNAVVITVGSWFRSYHFCAPLFDKTRFCAGSNPSRGEDSVMFLSGNNALRTLIQLFHLSVTFFNTQ